MDDSDSDAVEAIGASFGRLVGALHTNGVITDEQRDEIAEPIRAYVDLTGGDGAAADGTEPDDDG